MILNGVNYLLTIDGVERRSGFYVTRYVEADDPDQAEAMAVDLIRADQELMAMIRNSDQDPPKILLDEMYEIDSFEDLETFTPGYGFYFDEES